MRERFLLLGCLSLRLATLACYDQMVVRLWLMADGVLSAMAGLVSSVHGRSGAVVGVAGDYTVSQIVNVAANTISATTVQGAIDELDTEKQNLITGAALSIVSADLTADRVVVSDNSGKVTSASVTAVELGHLSGVNSNVQTQLDAKAATIRWSG